MSMGIRPILGVPSNYEITQCECREVQNVENHLTKGITSVMHVPFYYCDIEGKTNLGYAIKWVHQIFISLEFQMKIS